MQYTSYIGSFSMDGIYIYSNCKTCLKRVGNFSENELPYSITFRAMCVCVYAFVCACVRVCIFVFHSLIHVLMNANKAFR